MERPYLSLVATARNDDHGVNMLRRLQTFINALVAQAKRHAVSLELVLVEWNPPSGKPPLAQALRWPDDSGPCRIRIITVPPEIHRRYKLADVLPLYQMIGKNAGIRRAEGEYILATNIDILFSDELMQFVRERRLEPGRMYRIDRYDAASDVPVDASVDEQLTYCRKNLLRINIREGTYPLNSDGRRSPCVIDIAGRDTGISFGAGWRLPEQHFGQLFRIACGDAKLGIKPAESLRVLLIELQTIPASSVYLPLTFYDDSGRALGEVRINGRAIVRIQIPAGVAAIRLSSGDITATAAQSPLNFKAFRCQWDQTARAQGPSIWAESSPARRMARAWRIARSAAQILSDVRQGKGAGRIGLPFSSQILERFRPEEGGVSFAFNKARIGHPIPKLLPDQLHTNACGDFTLAHRSHWMDLRGYPEFDLYSMNLDAVFCYMAHYGGAPEHALTEPMRIYHIEHSEGSGWTPEGQKLLYSRLADKGIPWLPYEVVVHWASQMKSLGTTMVFNREDWGLGGVDLCETYPAAR